MPSHRTRSLYIVSSILLMMLSIVVVLGVVTADTIDIPTSKDAHTVQQSYDCPTYDCSDQNYGSDPEMKIADYHIVARAVIAYKFNSIPSQASIQKVELYLPHSMTVGGYETGEVKVEQLLDNVQWQENTVTYNSLPSVKPGASLGNVDVKAEIPEPLDVTQAFLSAFESSRVNGEFGIKLSPVLQTSVFMPSKEAEPKASYLRVTYTMPSMVAVTWDKSISRIISRRSGRRSLLNQQQLLNLYQVEGTQIIQIANNHVGDAILLSAQGSVYSKNTSNSAITRIPSLSNIVQICSGKEHNVALNRNGRVYSWGINKGQLGFSSDSQSTEVPQSLPADTFANIPIIKISCGEDHTMALDNNGNVWTWGYDHNVADEKTPTQEPVKDDSVRDIVAIAAGVSSSYAQSSDGQVYELMPYPTNVRKVDGLKNIVSIEAGSNLFAIDKSGNLWSYGSDVSTLGRPINTNADSAAVIYGINNVKQLSSSANDVIALTSSGAVYAWGARLASEDVYYRRIEVDELEKPQYVFTSRFGWFGAVFIPACGSNGTFYDATKNFCCAGKSLCSMDQHCNKDLGQCYTPNSVSAATCDTLQISYNPLSQQCCKGTIVCGNEESCCGVGQAKATPQCYNKDTQFCCNSRVVCAKGQNCCGDKCYDPKVSTCHNGLVRSISQTGTTEKQQSNSASLARISTGLVISLIAWVAL